MSTFAPSLQDAGARVTRAPYASGTAGHAQSLQMIAQKIREGSASPRVAEWAAGVLHAAGLHGRDHRPIVRQQAQALLDAFRAQTVYAPDPVNKESIQGADVTLCLTPNLCIPKGDCFPEGTLLLRREDYALVSIEKIRPGDEIWGRVGWTTVKWKAFKGPLRTSVVTLNNGSNVPLTKDHHVYVGICDRHSSRVTTTPCQCPWEERRIERITVGELRAGMMLPQPKRLPFGADPGEADRRYIEGLYIADGWKHGDQTNVNAFRIAGKDGHPKQAQKQRVKEICEQLGITTHWHARYITVKDKTWALRMVQMGDKAWLKHVLSLDLDEGPAAALLRGIMADSGGNSHGGGRTFTTTSKLLATQVRVLHRMFGIRCGSTYIADHGGEGEHPIWRLYIPGPSKTRQERLLRVKHVEHNVAKVRCWDIGTEEGYVYLPEHDVSVSNCDDGVVAVGSATANLGITTMVVKEDYPNGEQSHVLLACRDEDGEWFTVDPSTLLSVGTSQSPKGTKRTWVNPMENTGAEIIGIGRPFTEGVEIISIDVPTGVGADPQTPPTIPGTWSNVPDNVVKAGLRYAVAVVSPGDWTQDDITKFFAPDWLVENVFERTDLPSLGPESRAWIMMGLARHDATLVDGVVGINAVLQEQPPPAAQPQPPAPPGTTNQPQPPPDQSGVAVGAILAWGLGLVAVGGLAYGAYEYKRKHGHHLLSEPKQRRRLRA